MPTLIYVKRNPERKKDKSLKTININYYELIQVLKYLKNKEILENLSLIKKRKKIPKFQKLSLCYEKSSYLTYTYLRKEKWNLIIMPTVYEKKNVSKNCFKNFFNVRSPHRSVRHLGCVVLLEIF